MTIPQKRKDTKIENISDLPKKVVDKYRSDTHLGTVLDRERVVSKNQLKKKYRED
jgi:hypothetical protein